MSAATDLAWAEAERADVLAKNAEFHFLTNVEAIGAGPSVCCRGLKAGLRVQVSSRQGVCSATVTIEGSENDAAWVTLATLKNPGVEIWEGTPCSYMRLNVPAWSAGSINACGSSENAKLGQWHQIGGAGL